MQNLNESTYAGLNNKFYGDDAKKTYETRTKDANWTVDTSIYSSPICERFKDDLDNPLYLALLKEEESQKKVKKFKRTTPEETFADNHYDPFYCAAYRRIY